ncbi:phosphotransferase family protein, partial [Umezawaea sp.]|uniref:phosphotransferase family protein n=1 Tax=Umezawaea sp. TaxID=1955258 RepID=UPI002ED0D53F
WVWAGLDVVRAKTVIGTLFFVMPRASRPAPARGRHLSVHTFAVPPSAPRNVRAGLSGRLADDRAVALAAQKLPGLGILPGRLTRRAGTVVQHHSNGHSDEPRRDVGGPTRQTVMADLRQARDTARAIAAATLGHDPGPMSTAHSRSHHVYLGSDIVVKIIDAAGHSRLDREIALAPHLPTGLTAPLLNSGLHRLGTREVRYACYTRVLGTAPGIGMPRTDGATARLLTEQAVQRLDALHSWTPVSHAKQTLAETVDHGGFVGKAALVAEIENLAALDRNVLIARRVLDGLTAIAERAPLHSRVVVPVHADCHWDNWLANDRSVTALLDFEWARFGDPVDDWFFLARFSGPHLEAVLDVIARATAACPEVLRAECEVREAAYLVSDLRVALTCPGGLAEVAFGNLRDLDELVVERRWWRQGR